MIRGNILDLSTGEIYPGEVEIRNGLIKCVRKVTGNFKNYLLPGFIDAHIHIESSMLTPSRFSEAVVPHGTTAVVADPHEIANVMGLNGIKYMVKDSNRVPIRFYYTAPSCVTATVFKTSGATLGVHEIDRLLEDDNVVALGEMMNFPGVIEDDPNVLEKLKAAKNHKKPSDGHAPLLSGKDLCKYISTGISTDHECTSREEALEKRSMGMKIMIRDGSSARNMDDLWEIGGDFLVSDDKHPEDLLRGHLDHSLKKAVELGIDPLEAVKMVTINPAEHYGLESRGLTPGRVADMVVVDNLEDFNVKKVFISGKIVAEDGKALFNIKPQKMKSTFHLNKKNSSDFDIISEMEKVKVRVIQVLEGQLLTLETERVLKVEDMKIQPDLDNDVLKISVVERYGYKRISNAFVKGFKFKEGALASSVAHDSHNIIVIGTDGDKMAEAVNMVRSMEGGLVCVSDKSTKSLELPIAGLMSTENVQNVSHKLGELHHMVENMGCEIQSPFMTLSFLALLVIPQLRISDQGLFDVESFQFVDVVK
jgi:adenine deaminase